MRHGLILILILCLVGISGCIGAHNLGYAGAHPGSVSCKGKGSITGTGYLGANAGIGGQQNNTFTLQADCGDGFSFSQGLTPEATPPSK